jgi:hypothetical protein
MKPKGLVAAASTTSHTSIPVSWHNMASSFTRATFTCRNVFSRSLASSAARQEDTTTTFSTSCS